MKVAPVRVLLIGSRGRMGRAIGDVAVSEPDVEIAAECDQGDSIEAGMKICQVAIDFSAADSIEEICRLALQWRRPLVIGTTGHSTAQKTAIENAAKSLPIVFACNFS